MNEDMVKGFILGGLNATMFVDKETHIEKTENALNNVDIDVDIEELVDELIEEGWIKYNEEGNNIQTSIPEDEVEA